MEFTNAAELLALCEKEEIGLGEAMLRRGTALTGAGREEILERMARSLLIMREAAATALAAPQKTMGGLIGGEAMALDARRKTASPVCGPLMARAIAIAMGTLEVNASMGLIVAAPTAGSCGVLPGALLSQAEAFGFGEEQLLDALLSAGAVGYLIARNATVAGAEPEMAPKKAQVATMTMAKPPVKCPKRESPRLTRRLERPPPSIRAPARIKKGTAIRGKESQEVNMLVAI